MTIATASGALIGVVCIAFFTELLVQVEKKIAKDFPSNMLALITAVIVTALGSVGYIFYAKIAVTPVVVIGIIALAIIECYISMFGYDKLIQMIKQYKEYIDKSSNEE